MLLPSRLLADIENAGYYPQIAVTAVSDALLDETVVDHLVYTGTHMDLDTVQRLMMVFVLTPTRLIISRLTDEPQLDPGWSEARATCSTEEIPLKRVTAPTVMATYADPADFRPGDKPVEVQLLLNWGVRHRLELIPDSCGHPDCDADHGYTGGAFSEDVAMRFSAQAEGQAAVDAAVSFARSMRLVMLAVQRAHS